MNESLAVREAPANYQVGLEAQRVRPGYKQTEVGVIPEDWEVKQIGDFVSISVGRDLKEEQYATFQDDVFKYPVFSNTVADEGLYGFYNVSEYNGESLTVVGRGIGLGRAFKRSGGYGAIGRLLVLFPAQNIDASFLTEYINNRVKIFSESGGIPQLTGLSIAKYRVPLPPTKAEQEAIAEALSDADALIESLEQLIAKKRHLKQGTMQELLTGNKRLPGFSVEWIGRSIGDVLTIAHGKSQHSVTDQNGIYPILATGGRIGTANRFLYDKPSVLIGRKGTIDRPQYMDQPFWTVDTLFYSVIHEPNNAKYLFYQFCLIDWKQHNEASGVPSLNARTIERIELLVPPPEEQTAIATILSDMDIEIVTLETRLAKTRELKQGMMHNLLTGRIRLV